MAKFIIRRVGEAILTLFLISLVVFLLLQLVPGDPTWKMLGENADPALYEPTRIYYGYDKPVLVQYWNWLSKVLRNDWGISYGTYQPVLDTIGSRLTVTFFLSILSFVISSVLGIALGVLTAVKRGKFIDTAITSFANFMGATPSFWLGVLLIYFFAVKLNWLPFQGVTLPWTVTTGAEKLIAYKQLILPVTCMAIYPLCGTIRQIRTAMLEVIRQDYIRTARAKGLSVRKVLFKHALRNAMVPIITMLGQRIGTLVGGSAFVETVFGIAGIGSLLVSATASGNIPVLLAIVLLISSVGCVANLLTDLLYGVVDPRIRLE